MPQMAHDWSIGICNRKFNRKNHFFLFLFSLVSFRTQTTWDYGPFASVLSKYVASQTSMCLYASHLLPLGDSHFSAKISACHFGQSKVLKNSRDLIGGYIFCPWKNLFVDRNGLCWPFFLLLVVCLFARCCAYACACFFVCFWKKYLLEASVFFLFFLFVLWLS